MTELSFLLDLLLNHKLPKPVRAAVTARIKDVEGRLSPTLERRPNPASGATQPPSTLAALARQEPLPVIANSPVVLSGQVIDKETGRPSVITGTSNFGSTRGPRKF